MDSGCRLAAVISIQAASPCAELENIEETTSREREAGTLCTAKQSSERC